MKVSSLSGFTTTITAHSEVRNSDTFGVLKFMLNTTYYRASVAAKVFTRMDTHLYYHLFQWTTHRHTFKTKDWSYRHYLRRIKGRVVFSDGENLPTKHIDILFRNSSGACLPSFPYLIILILIRTVKI